LRQRSLVGGKQIKHASLTPPVTLESSNWEFNRRETRPWRENTRVPKRGSCLRPTGVVGRNPAKSPGRQQCGKVRKRGQKSGGAKKRGASPATKNWKNRLRETRLTGWDRIPPWGEAAQRGIGRAGGLQIVWGGGGGAKGGGVWVGGGVEQRKQGKLKKGARAR